MKQLIRKIWPHLAAILGLALFCIIYFLPETAENKTLPQYDVQHSMSNQVEIKKFAQSEDREILWTNSLFGGMPTFQIYGAGGETYNGLQFVAYQTMKLFKPLTSPTGLMFACGLGFYILMLCFGFNWKWCLSASLIFAVSTSFNNLIAAGHVNKIMTLALLAPTLGGLWLIFNKKYLAGGAITALFVNLQLMANHPQISYYFSFVAVLFGIGAGIQLIRSKDFKALGMSIGVILLAITIGILPNLPKLLTTQEYAAESIRGKTELKTTSDKPTDGLSKSYAFQYSLGKSESFSHIIPNYFGGNSGAFFAMDPNSRTTAYLQSIDPKQANQLMQASSEYFGPQLSTGGAWYWGVTVVFLFFVGFFSTKHWIKWWGLASLLMIMILSWGDHFEAVNYFLFDHFPLFNRFRVVAMIVNLAHMVLLLVGLYGLKTFFDLSKEDKIKVVKNAGAIMLGLSILGLAKAWFGNLSGPVDTQLSSVPDFVAALRADRAALVKKDGFRAILFVLLLGSIFWIYAKKSFNQWLALGLIVGLCLIDLISVDKRYLTNDKFEFVESLDDFNVPRPIDERIMQDKGLSYRVIDFTTNPFSDAFASTFHKNTGGYHPAKLRIYQDVIEKYLQDPQKYMHVYNMLNTKYFIVGDAKSPNVQQNPLAMGNAWFANEISIVNDADEELNALGDSINTRKAIINKKFEKYVTNKSITPDPKNTVQLVKYIPDDLTYQYHAETPQFLVFSEVYYPEEKGWHAYIDGKRKEGLVRSSYVLRGIEVPAGDHTIELKFEPESYYLGQKLGKIGSIALLILVLGALFQGIKPYLKPENGVAK